MNELKQMFSKFSHSHHFTDIFYDWVTVTAISISNFIIFNEDDENLYLTILKKYTNDEIEMFSKMTAMLTMLFEENAYDYLGELYMQCAGSSNKLGQFFTPYHLAQLNARLSLQNYNGDLINISEPSCGGSGMIIATAEELQNSGFNYQELMNVVASDLDVRCVYMSYVQLSLLGINAKVIHENSLTNERFKVLYTPMHVLKGGFRE